MTTTATTTQIILRPFHVKARVLWEGRPVRYAFHLHAKTSAAALGVVQTAIEKVYGRDAQLISTVVTPV